MNLWIDGGATGIRGVNYDTINIKNVFFKNLSESNGWAAAVNMQGCTNVFIDTFTVLDSDRGIEIEEGSKYVYVRNGYLSNVADMVLNTHKHGGNPDNEHIHFENCYVTECKYLFSINNTNHASVKNVKGVNNNTAVSSVGNATNILIENCESDFTLNTESSSSHITIINYKGTTLSSNAPNTIMINLDLETSDVEICLTLTGGEIVIGANLKSDNYYDLYCYNEGGLVEGVSLNGKVTKGIWLKPGSSSWTIKNCDFNGRGLTDAGTNNRYFKPCSGLFMDALAASTNAVHAAITGTGAELEVTTAITNPDVPRNVSITNSANSTGNVVITGVDAKGNSVTDTITISTGGVAYGVVAFSTVSKITLPATVENPDTIAVGISDKLGLSNIIYATSDVYKIKKNNADATVATAQVSTTYDTYDMSVIDLAGTDDFTIYYKSNLNIIE